MDFIAEYKSKLGTPEQAAALVKSGDWVEYGNARPLPPSATPPSPSGATSSLTSISARR